MAPARGLNPPGGAVPPGPPQRPPRPRWLRLTLALLLLVPLVELVVAILVGRAIGGGLTVVLLLVCSLLGLVLVRREGRRSWEALQRALASGAMPARQIADAMLVLVGGLLLLAPGFVTAVVGLFFLLPFTRPLTRRWLELAVSRRLLRTPGVPPGMGGPSGPGGPSGSTGPFGGPSRGGPQRPQGPSGPSGPGASGPSGNAGGGHRKPPPDDDIIEGEIL